MIPLLKFSKSNGKLSNRLIFSFQQGTPVPMLVNVIPLLTEILVKSQTTLMAVVKSPEYRCFAAMAEARFPTVRKSRWHNFDQLKAARNIYVDQHPEIQLNIIWL